MQLLIDMTSDTYTRVCAGEVIGHHLHELYNSVRNGVEVEQKPKQSENGRREQMTKEAEREMFIVRRLVDAIDNFDELKIAYDEEKQVIREALVRFGNYVMAVGDNEKEVSK